MIKLNSNEFQNNWDEQFPWKTEFIKFDYTRDVRALEIEIRTHTHYYRDNEVMQDNFQCLKDNRSLDWNNSFSAQHNRLNKAHAKMALKMTQFLVKICR